MLQSHSVDGMILSVVELQHVGQLAQLVEQRTLNPWVQGSSP